MYLTKRPHLKSRAGCQGCKRRKIKCDEASPTCTFCGDRNLQCIYIRSVTEFHVKSSNPSHSSGSLSDSMTPKSHHLAFRIHCQESLQIPLKVNNINEKNAKQIQMLHHWFVSTHECFNVQRYYRCVKTIWQVDIPRLAFEHDFLMSSILAVTCLHLQHLRPDEPDVQHKIAIYQDKAIRGFQTAISNIAKCDYGAVMATSLLFVVLGMGRRDMHSEGELRISNWLGLSIGVQSLLKSLNWQNTTESRIASIFDFRGTYNPGCVSPIIPQHLQEMMSRIDTNDSDWEYLEALEHSIKLLGRLYGRLALVRSPAPELELEIWSWPAQLTPVFNVLVKELRPRALVIMGHYLAFFQLVSKPWWARGTEKEIAAIIQAVNFEWRPLLEVPGLAIESNDKEVVIKLLLGQLHSEDIPQL